MLIYSDMPGIYHVFPNKPNHLGLPSLIETSNRATTRLVDLNFWQEIIIYPRPKMYHVLKILKFSSMTYDDVERRSLMNKLIEIAIENEDRAFKKEECCVLAVNFLIERKLKQRLI